ncbi:MAG: 2Fe-2S iron-sulfur cluster-binding protein [Candidatus Methanoperedens sp.]|nr:2Fe-2S iron-sulfur cluster-binding protein [Candidatus Methanoperedens sp.]
MKIELRISRFDPEKDRAPYYRTYTIDAEKHTTVLDALIHIKDCEDDTLTFRRSCRSGICGSCAVRVNHRACLACKTRAMDSIYEGCILVEPLKNLRIIRDLVVDLDPFFRTIEQVSPWITRDCTAAERRMYPADVRELNKTGDCIMCGACYSDCNVLDVDRKFLGPAGLVKCYRFVVDPRDNLASERIKQAIELGIFKCPVDQECELACPAHIGIRRDVIESLRHHGAKYGIAPMPAHRRLIQSVLDTGGVVPVKTEPAIERHQHRERSFNGITEVYFKDFDGEPENDIVLFLGCIINRRQQESADAIINILQHNRIAVHLPKRQTCCGSPFMRSGMYENMRPFVSQNIDIFNSYAEHGVRCILTSCSGCNSTFRHDYPGLAVDYGLAVNYRIFDTGEYMYHLLRSGKLNEDFREIRMSTMYHYPCHIRASGLEEGIYVDLIERIPGLVLKQVPSSGLCCGGGGGVRAAYPELADKLAIRRMNIAQEEGVDSLFTNCPFCILSFERGIKLREDAGEALHFKIYDFYRVFSEAYGGTGAGP